VNTRFSQQTVLDFDRSIPRHSAIFAEPTGNGVS
jgi:hypothetical protein